jgi:hypothetical protein
MNKKNITQCKISFVELGTASFEAWQWQANVQQSEYRKAPNPKSSADI